MSNYLRPRYKISFQSKNKVYLNKNSKFRLFYLIRGKFFKRRDGKYRSNIKLNNMKWTVARRFFCSRTRRRNNLRFHYKNTLIAKQQVKKFYGKIREYQFQKLLKNACYLQHKYKQNIFLSNLENRLDILLLRMHLFPTIFMANQFILHQGVYVDNEKSFLPHIKINNGSIISIDKKHWKIIYKYLLFKLSNRYKGHTKWEKFLNVKKLKQKIKFQRYFRRRQRKNLKLLDELNGVKKKYTKLKLFIWQYNNFDKKTLIKILKKLLLIEMKIKNLRNSLMIMRRWKAPAYYRGELFVILNYIFIYFLLEQFDSFLITAANKNKSFISSYNNDHNLLNFQDDKNKISIYEPHIHNFIKKLLKGTYLVKIQKIKLKEKKIQKINNKLKFNDWWCKKPHWYLPAHLEIDYKTLRLSVVEEPSLNNISYPFSNSIYKLICFYTDKGFKT